jgi:hypothetical protein
MPATVWPVVKLTEPSVLHGLGHVVATDNWYTSLGTVAELSKEPKRMHTIGTVRTNKKGLPKQGIFPAKGKQVKKQGEFACHKLANKEVYFVSWMDNKPVHLLMTWEPYSSSVGRVEKGKKDGYVRKTIPIPTAVQAYNASMGGTDKFDKFSSYYDDRLRTVSWKHRLFAHFSRAACINAHILFNIKTGQILSFLKFIQGFIAEWAGDVSLAMFDSDSEDDEEYWKPSKPRYHHKKQWEADTNLRLCGVHVPLKFPTPRKTDANGKLKDRRKACNLCNSKTPFICHQCGAALCIGEKYSESCWTRFHTEETWSS